MSKIRSNQITNENLNGAPEFPHGLTTVGVQTVSLGNTSITGNLTVNGDANVGGVVTTKTLQVLIQLVLLQQEVD